jgi:hypothetical protein
LEAGLFAAAYDVTLAFALLGSASFAFLLSRPLLAVLSSLPSNPWWLVYRDAGTRGVAQPLEIIIATTVVTTLALLFCLRSYRLYRHNRTPILPFPLLFFLTLGIEGLRGGGGSHRSDVCHR